MTTNLIIPVPADVEKQLRARARAAGESLDVFAARILENAARIPDLAEISGPIYQNFLASGMTDAELGDHLEEAKHAMRSTRRGRPKT